MTKGNWQAEGGEGREEFVSEKDNDMEKERMTKRTVRQKEGEDDKRELAGRRRGEEERVCQRERE